jgi:tetratricopeptide (TPR) repeat protein
LRYAQCERKWVVLSKSDTAKSYPYGFIYIDEQAGFTYDVKGEFKVGPNNIYIPDTAATKGTSIKARIGPNWRRGIALVPTQHFAELGIKPQPDWIKYYYTYTDTLKHDYRWGWIYNDLGESAIAIKYLEPAYRLKPNAKEVDFELGFAYNVLNRYDDAIRVLTQAIQDNPDYALFYKEIGYAHTQKHEYIKAIDAYKLGLQYYPDKVTEARGELAFNMAQAYKALGNDELYKSWMTKAKSFTPPTSQYYKLITDAGF